MGTIGKAESAYLPGVRVPDVTLGGVAERAGIRSGDVLLRVGEYEVRAAPDQVRGVYEVVGGRAIWGAAGAGAISGGCGKAAAQGQPVSKVAVLPVSKGMDCLVFCVLWVPAVCGESVHQAKGGSGHVVLYCQAIILTQGVSS